MVLLFVAVKLTYQVQLLNVIDEAQQDIVMEKLISIFCKRHDKVCVCVFHCNLPLDFCQRLFLNLVKLLILLQEGSQEPY